MIDDRRGFSPKPFQLMLETTFNIIWRVPRASKVTAKMESENLVITFSYSVPTQANLESLKFPTSVNLEQHTVQSDRILQPRKHVVKFLLPPTVIRENYTCHRTADLVAFQFQVGRSTNFEIKIPS